MKKLELADVKKAAMPLDGQRLYTLRYKKPFHFEVQPTGFIYTPESSGTSERQDWKYIERFLERFNEINSFAPSDYKDISHCASYFLPVIRSITK
jgi:hypothetical protein